MKCKKGPSPGLGPFLDSYYISMTHFRHFRGELRLILHTQDGPMYKQQFPMYNSIWPNIGLGPFLYSGTQLLYAQYYSPEIYN